MITFKIQVFSVIFSILFLAAVIRLIVKGKLRVEYSILWLFWTIILIVFSFWRKGLDKIAEILDVNYAPALFFLGAIFVILVFLIHLSVVNSKQHEQIKTLSQDIAILKNKLKHE